MDPQESQGACSLPLPMFFLTASVFTRAAMHEFFYRGGYGNQY